MLLYHYTDQIGFIGIIDSKKLWATKIQYLNDSEELYLSFQYAKDILQTQLFFAKNDNNKATIKRLIANLKNITHINICVCSLSANGDLLSQWRGYSKTQGGYSIGFDFTELEILAKKSGYMLKKCIYNEGEQRKLIEETVMETLEKFSTYKEPHSDSPEFTSDSVEYFNNKMVSIAPLFKSETFSEEEEWRLISIGGISLEKLSFRPSISMLIPYHALEFRRDFWEIIKLVIVGHTPHADLAINSTDSFLYKNIILNKDLISENHSSHNINIIKSKIPYRNW